MSNILLGVIGNGRRELLEQTVASAESHLQGHFFKKVMINDAPSPEYNKYLTDTYTDRFVVINHDHNRGLSGSVRTLWEYAQVSKADYVFHLEEDFIFNEDIDLQDMIRLLEDPDIAQVALKRQPCNPAEIEVGGFMEQAPQTYLYRYLFAPHRPGDIHFLEHRNFFTLNPCMYSIQLTKIGWEQGWGEKEFGERLFSNELIKCAYLGKIDDAPLVTHTGDYRGENWYV